MGRGHRPRDRAREHVPASLAGTEILLVPDRDRVAVAIARDLCLLERRFRDRGVEIGDRSERAGARDPAQLDGKVLIRGRETFDGPDRDRIAVGVARDLGTLGNILASRGGQPHDRPERAGARDRSRLDRLAARARILTVERRGPDRDRVALAVDRDLGVVAVLAGHREVHDRPEGAGARDRSRLDLPVGPVEALPDRDRVAVGVACDLRAEGVLPGGREVEDRPEGAAARDRSRLDPPTVPVEALPDRDRVALGVAGDLGVEGVPAFAERVIGVPRTPPAEIIRALARQNFGPRREKTAIASPSASLAICGAGSLRGPGWCRRAA